MTDSDPDRCPNMIQINNLNNDIFRDCVHHVFSFVVGGNVNG